MRQRGTSYYRASLFFPKTTKDEVFLVYAFVRICDNVVDTPVGTHDQKRETLQMMKKIFADLYNTTADSSSAASIHSHDMVLTPDILKIFADTAHLFHAKNIPLQYAEDFFGAMLADTSTSRYGTYQELNTYMYGSAKVIGRIMNRIVGVQGDQKVLDVADKYGDMFAEAMQYTNFLRDIKEDYEEYGRIYMPADRLATYNLSYTDIVGLCSGALSAADERWQSYMREQISSARALYKEGYKGISLLPSSCQKAIYFSGKLYEAILSKIEANMYDVFSLSARTTKREKIKAVLPYLLKHEF